MKTITATIHAYVASYYTMDDIVNVAPENAVNRLMFSINPLDGYIQIGTAEIRVTIDSQEDIVSRQISTLQEAKKRIQAETQQKLNAIDEQIGKLQCLEYRPEAA